MFMPAVLFCVHFKFLYQCSSLFFNLQAVVRDLDPTNDLTFLRIRSKKSEIMVAPDKEFILIVVQNPVD